MKHERYVLTAIQHNGSYEFFSEGPKGIIKKVIEYEEISPGIFNLAFGDWDEVNQQINDKSRTNNADRDKVLATVAASVKLFMDSHPGAIIAAKGETAAKTRLYQMGLNQNWLVIKNLYQVNGFREERWEPFIPGRNYDAFTLQMK
jgi:hypothetical protein